MTTKVIICLDGCAPDYLEQGETPNLDAIVREGFHTIGEAVVPTVTNVNNTSIITASLPETHGITTNYLLDSVSGRECYMESADYLLTGDLPAPREELQVRSHGSLHEREIPIYALGKGPLALRPRSNSEAASWIFNRKIRTEPVKLR